MSLFGGSSLGGTSGATGSSLFGGSSSSSGGSSLFGNTPSSSSSSSSLFGNSGASSGSSLFGASTSPSSSSTSSGSLFGNTSSSGGLFGNSSSSSSSSSSLSTGGSLFGGSSGSGGLFGNSSSSSSSSSGGSLFGGSSLFNNSSSSSSSSAWGSSPFSSTGTSSSSSLFGNTGSTFSNIMGGSTSSVFENVNVSGMPSLTGTQSAINQPTVEMEVMRILQQLKTLFESYVFVLAPQEIADNVMKLDPRLWEHAKEEAKESAGTAEDAKRLIPIPIKGFTQLKQWMEKQREYASDLNAQLEEESQNLRTIKSNHDLKTVIKLEECKNRHIELTKQVLEIEVLQNKGIPVMEREERFMQKLETMQKELNKPTQFKGRLNELSSLVRMQETASAQPYDPIDTESLPPLIEYLQLQRKGLDRLKTTVEKDMRDLDHIKKELSDLL